MTFLVCVPWGLMVVCQDGDAHAHRRALSDASIAQVFMLSSDAQLDAETMKRVLGSGHSRIPVHRPGHR